MPPFCAERLSIPRITRYFQDLEGPGIYISWLHAYNLIWKKPADRYSALCPTGSTGPKSSWQWMFQLKFGWINLPTSTINILFAERQNFDCNFCLYCSILVGLQTDISRPIYGLYGISTYTYMIVLFFLYLINFFRTATGRFYPCMYCLPVSANIPSSRCCATV